MNDKPLLEGEKSRHSHSLRKLYSGALAPSEPAYHQHPPSLSASLQSGYLFACPPWARGPRPGTQLNFKGGLQTGMRAMGLHFSDVMAAAERLQGRIHRTPLLESLALNNLTGGRILVKADNLQLSGSFKVRQLPVFSPFNARDKRVRMSRRVACRSEP